MASDRGGMSMLDKLASGIVDEKVVKGAKLSPALTPVGAETRLPNDTGVFMSTEALTAHAANLRAFAADALKIADGIDVMLGVPAAVEAAIAADKETSQKLIEREADRRAADRAKAAEGDKRAEARVAAEEPMEKVVARVNDRDAKRAAVLAAMMGADDSGSPAETVAAMSAAGDEAAETFDARMKRLGDEAQAATFSSPTVPAAPGDGWSCPDHGDTNIVVKTSPRRGVEFRKCAAEGCRNFEKV